MSFTQFPPSSPFLDHHEEDNDPFSSKSSKKFVINSPFNKKLLDKNASPTKDAYPTPNPSSSAGVRSSSPARVAPHSSDLSEAEEAERSVEYKSPLDDALRIKISPNQTTTLGRSSRCDYFVRSKYASRVHLKLQYNSEFNELTVLCKGFNGVIINFGQKLHGVVKQFENNTFHFQRIPKGEATSEDEEFTDLSVVRDEQITVPFLESLTLDIKGHVTLLDLENDDSETEDELPVLNSRYSSVEPKAVEQAASSKVILKPVEAGTVKKVETRKEVDDIKPVVSKSQDVVEKKTTAKIDKPVVESKKVEHAVLKQDAETPLSKPVVQEASSAKSTESVPKRELKQSKSMETIKAVELSAMEDKSRSKSVEPSKKPASTVTIKKTPNSTTSTPLKPKSESQLNKQQQPTKLQTKTTQPESQQSQAQVQRRRKAEPGLSPQKKKQVTKQHQQPRDKISQLNIKEVMSTVQELSNVQNVLINHLAFSRTSQTPLYQLQQVSAVTQALSRTQLRAVLFDLQCIGTIYRKGKDAAGKPLDEEYYYDVERDQDFERKGLVESVKGASGLRNCRKVHKQYFWKRPTK